MATKIEYGLVALLIAIVAVTAYTEMSPQGKKAVAAPVPTAKPIPKPIPNLDPVLAGKLLTYLHDKCHLSSVSVRADNLSSNITTSRGYACKSFVASVENTPWQYSKVYIDNPKWAAQEMGMENSPVTLASRGRGEPNFTIRSIQYGK